VPFGCPADCPADIVVLEDRALGFRHGPSSDAWPGVVKSRFKSGGSDAGQEDTRERTGTGSPMPSWLVMATHGPLCQGDLWRTVSGAFGDRTVLVTTIEDIRREEVFVSKSISWERTALDLVGELRHNPVLQALAMVKDLVITIGLEGARDSNSKDPMGSRWQLEDCGRDEQEGSRMLGGVGPWLRRGRFREFRTRLRRGRVVHSGGPHAGACTCHRKRRSDQQLRPVP